MTEFSNSVLLYKLYKLHFSGRMKDVHKGNNCSYTIRTEMLSLNATVAPSAA
jgi:hypothetical protein